MVWLCLAWPVFALESLAPLPLSTNVDEAKRQLGERLFHDNKLSAQNNRSCASCHPLDHAAMDGLPRAEANDGTHSLRNTPSLFNVGFNFFYNWDGVVSTLEAHTEKVMLNPKVMNTSWSALLASLQADADYKKAFTQVYPTGLIKENIVDAMVNFERSLITPNSRFDQFLRGNQHALSDSEQQGYRLFTSLGCAACHQGINIGGNLFQKFGVFAQPKSLAKDPGRYSVTNNERDKGVYRVPSLRNVAVTAPYFHDGSAATLAEAVDTMAHDQLGRTLSEQERNLLLEFLTTLTGEYQGKPVVGGVVTSQ
ncbi:cytochrome-c peroxidase [Methylocucumis oryzae]|nr:cytochrome c peroxidase [Methylocucumis oryzae]